LNQEKVEATVFISDDTSSDSTLEIVGRIGRIHSNVVVIDNSTRFGSAAANFFNLVRRVDVSGFDYVAFSDQDDIWFPDKLISAVTQMNLHECVGFSSDVIAKWECHDRSVLVKKSHPQTQTDFLFESPGPGCSQVFKVQAFGRFQEFVIREAKELQNIDYHDWIVYVFFRLNHLPWLISDSPKMYYMQHSNNETGVNFGFRAILKRVMMIRSKWYRSQIELMYRLVSGKSDGLISLRFILRNLLSLRRKQSHSIALFFLFLFGLL
jgi:rhamnosyltransferase